MLAQNSAADDLVEEASGGFFLPAYEEHFAHVWDEVDGLVLILSVVGALLVIWQFFTLLNQFRRGDPTKRLVIPLAGGLLFATALIMPHVMIPFYLGLIDAVISFFASLGSGISS